MASSSRKRSKPGTPAAHPRLSPAIVARCLKFTNPAHKERFEKLQKRQITATGCIHLPMYLLGILRATISTWIIVTAAPMVKAVKTDGARVP